MSPGGTHFVSEALAWWILEDLDRSGDFGREGLPACNVKTFLSALGSSSRLNPSDFAIALVGFGCDRKSLLRMAGEANLGSLYAISDDLHEATAWRNLGDTRPRIIALASGYNPSVHGLKFFARASSPELARKLLQWAQRQEAFTRTPAHRRLLEALGADQAPPGLQVLDGVAAFLASWHERSIDVSAPKLALPALGLLVDPGLFEATDLGARLEENLRLRETVELLSPAEVRDIKRRADRLVLERERSELLDAVRRLEKLRSGRDGEALTLRQADLLVHGRRVGEPVEVDPVELPQPVPTDAPTFSESAVDALLNGDRDHLNALGAALDEAWQCLEQNGNRLIATASTPVGEIEFDRAVDVDMLDWVRMFCDAERFGGLIETCEDGLSLGQALRRAAEFEPEFVVPAEIWDRDGEVRSIEDLLAGWDDVLQRDIGDHESLRRAWRAFVDRRASLVPDVAKLVVHPREWLDTHPVCSETCLQYLESSRVLYRLVQEAYRTVREASRDWAQATLDALLSLDIVQVRLQCDGHTRAKAVMLPLHPLHLWRYSRLGAVLAGLARERTLGSDERAALMAEVQRPEHFIGVVRVGATPGGRGLDQLLPAANDLHGLAAFENLHNAVSGGDGVGTLVQILEHFVRLHPNHARPLRLAIVNLPDPSKTLEELIKIVSSQLGGRDQQRSIEVEVFATEAHRDRLIAASTLEDQTQDLVSDKVAAGRFELRVAAEPAADLERLICEQLAPRCFHVVAVFDEASIRIRRRRFGRVMPMSPFCVRNEVVVDRLLGDVSLSPHPGDPPFSDFVTMIQEFDREQRDNTVYASADANRLRSAIDGLVTGESPAARWVMLADRALPNEEGMAAVRLLERADGRRQVLACAADHGRLATLLESEFSRCNVPMDQSVLNDLLRQGGNLVGSGLLDMVRRSSGTADQAKVIGFVGMLLAARLAYRDDPGCLVASVDSRIARLWLRLAPPLGGGRCDLLVIKSRPGGGFVVKCVEVKTTLDSSEGDSASKVREAAGQVSATAAAVRAAFADRIADRMAGGRIDAFAAPRIEMLKEVLVRAVSSKWHGSIKDVERKRVWGPRLREMLSDEARPVIEVEGEVILVRLRSAETPQAWSVQGGEGGGFQIRVRTITEMLANELLGGVSDVSASLGTACAVGDGVASRTEKSAPDVAAECTGEAVPVPPRVSGIAAASQFVGASVSGGEPGGPAVEASEILEERAAASSAVGGDWPPHENVLGMIGNHDVASNLVSLVKQCKAWNERCPDMLFEGPAGVGKTTVARRLAEDHLRLTLLLFNGADLRRPEMIVDRLRDQRKIPIRCVGMTVVEPCVLFVDEVHAIKSNVATALLSALDERRTTTVDNVVYDFSNVVFLLATTDPGKLSEAFVSRPRRVVLRSYSVTEMAGIVWVHARSKLDGADLSREACEEIAARMQCMPRPSVNILDNLIGHFFAVAEREGNGTPSRQQVAARMTASGIGEWFDSSEIDQNGLGAVHRACLEMLRKRGAVSEDELRRGLGVSNRDDFVDVVEYLSRLGLIQTGSGGRSLSPDGKRWMSLGGKMDLRQRISRRLGP